MNNRHQWRFNVSQRLMEPGTVAFLTFIREILMPLPGVTEKMCYNTPAFYVNKKIAKLLLYNALSAINGWKQRQSLFTLPTIT
jgi:hypothetical protein